MKLSVCLITYNHQRFIKQALEGVLMQQANFDWEIVIGDDCSTDGTVAIVEEYVRLYPDKIRLTGYKNNAGMTLNWLRTIGACKGEYIALLEGDDYWTDPQKLQKQVDIMDKNRHLSFTCHDVETIFEAGVPAIDYMAHPGVAKEYTIEEFIGWSDNFFVATGSIILRRSMLVTYPTWADDNLKVCIDLITEFLLSSKGNFFYLNEIMGKYRIHSGGVSQISWLGRENLFEFDVIQIFKRLNEFTHRKYNSAITTRVEWMYKKLLKKNDPKSPAYRKALLGVVVLKPIKNRDLLKGWVINHYLPPALYNLYKKVF